MLGFEFRYLHAYDRHFTGCANSPASASEFWLFYHVTTHWWEVLSGFHLPFSILVDPFWYWWLLALFRTSVPNPSLPDTKEGKKKITRWYRQVLEKEERHTCQSSFLIFVNLKIAFALLLYYNCHLIHFNELISSLNMWLSYRLASLQLSIVHIIFWCSNFLKCDWWESSQGSSFVSSGLPWIILKVSCLS